MLINIIPDGSITGLIKLLMVTTDAFASCLVPMLGMKRVCLRETSLVLPVMPRDRGMLSSYCYWDGLYLKLEQPRITS